MVALIEKELKTKDKELQELLKGLAIDTPDTTSKVNSINIEKEILHKLLIKQKFNQKKKASAVENGLLLFAMAIFGALAILVSYLVIGTNAISGTWEQMGTELALLILLFIMTGLSTTLYLQHYKQKVG